MPTAEQILASLRQVANDAFALAVAWHVTLAICGVALALGWRPARRNAGLLLTLLAVSVSAVSWLHHNPFNAATFALLSVVLAMLALSLGREAISFRAPGWALVLGAAMVAFGSLYPHFLERSALSYLYGAPTGLIPCPTLSLMVGASLLVGGLHSRAWSMTLALAGVFYAVWGAMHLGVYIDLVLLAGSLGLLVMRPHLQSHSY